MRAPEGPDRTGRGAAGSSPGPSEPGSDGGSSVARVGLVLFVVGALAVGAGVMVGIIDEESLSGLQDHVQSEQKLAPDEPLEPLPRADFAPVEAEPRPADTTPTTNPWGREEIVVAVADESGYDRPVELVVREAIDYWEAHSGNATYDFEFVFRPDDPDPDVLVRYKPDVVCERHEEASGCAPVLSPTNNPSDPAEVRIQAGPEDNYRTDRNSVIHEFGHLLGVEHCGEPSWTMDIGCADAPARPNVDDRRFAFREEPIRVYTDDGAVASEDRSVVAQQFRLGTRVYTAGEGDLPTVRIERVDDPYLADVVVDFGVAEGCDEGAAVCATQKGADVDGDGRIDYLTRATITVTDEPLGRQGWYYGAMFGDVVTPAVAPERFQEYERHWWDGVPALEPAA